MLRLKKSYQRRVALALVAMLAALGLLAQCGKEATPPVVRWEPDVKYPAVSVRHTYGERVCALSYRRMPRNVRAVPLVYDRPVKVGDARRKLRTDSSKRVITITTGPFHRNDRNKTLVGRNRLPGLETFSMGHGDRGWLVMPKPEVREDPFLSNDWQAITAERDKYYATEMGVVLLPKVATGGFSRYWLNRRTSRYAVGYNNDSFFVVQARKSSVWELRDFMKRVLECTHAALPDGGSAMGGNTRYLIAYCEP